MMANQKLAKRDDPKQSQLFIDKAREIEADEKKSSADALMGKLAHMPPDPKPKSKAGVKKKKPGKKPG